MGPADTTKPVVTASPAAQPSSSVTEARSVTLSSDENADIYITVDGSPALDNGDLPSDTANLYTGPIAITQRTTINLVAFDRAGNFGVGSRTFEPPAVVAPAAPALGASSAGQESVTLRWTATDPSITGYGVQLYNHATNQPVGGLRETTEKSLVITGLTAGTAYSFTVKAKNTDYGAPSPRSAPLTPTAVTDRIMITSAKWKAGDLRVIGTGSTPGATVTVHAGSKTGTVLGHGDGRRRRRLRPAPAQRCRPGQPPAHDLRGVQPRRRGRAVHGRLVRSTLRQRARAIRLARVRCLRSRAAQIGEDGRARPSARSPKPGAITAPGWAISSSATSASVGVADHDRVVGPAASAALSR